MTTKLFDNWSPEMAWVLGLIFTDGCIASSGWNVSLYSKDVDMLYSVRSLAKVDYLPNKHKNRNVYCLSLGSSCLVHKLSNFGLTPAKSRTMQFPCVPQQFLSHFVRGLWDGNGTIFTRFKTRPSKPYNKKPFHTNFEVNCGIVSGSLNFITSLRDNIEATLNIPSNIKTRKSIADRDYHEIYYYHRNSLILLPWLYADSTSDTRLSRKYHKAKQFLD